MPQNANRCPHCWAALAADVTDFCPFCRKSLGVKRQSRRGSEAPNAGPVTPPPPPPPPYIPYQPHEPGVSSAAPAVAAAPAAGAVAVLERDPVEYPGTPLPPDFFDALPERARKPRSRWSFGRVIGIATVVGIGVVSSVIADAGNEKNSSPARHLLAGPCAEYRDFTTRSDREAFEQGTLWFQSNADTFAAAARLDPDLREASEAVAWYKSAIEANFAPMRLMSADELTAKERPVALACYRGAGRA